MFLAIVAEINDTTDPEQPKVVKVIPIRTGELDKEVMARVKLPLLATRGEVERALNKALRDLETDTKLKTNSLSLGYK